MRDLAIVKFISKIFLSMFMFINGETGDFVISIFLLTVMVRFLLLPLAIKQKRFLLIQKEFSVKTKEFKNKFKDNKEELNQKTVELMTKAKMNPLGGMITMFAQMPVFVGLYATFLKLTDIGNHTFLPWVVDVSAVDSTHILPLLGVTINVINVKLASVNQTGGSIAASLNMLLIGAITLLILWKAPVGLAIYWASNGLLTCIESISLKSKLGLKVLQSKKTTDLLETIKSY